MLLFDHVPKHDKSMRPLPYWEKIIHTVKIKRTQVIHRSLMTACERVGDVKYITKVFRLLKEEEDDEDLMPNEIIYGAAISCCRKAKEPQRAMGLCQK
jgi:hypothetical protein